MCHMANDDVACSQYPGLVIPFDHSTEFDCEALINDSFYAGLSHLEESVCLIFLILHRHITFLKFPLKPKV